MQCRNVEPVGYEPNFQSKIDVLLMANILFYNEYDINTKTEIAILPSVNRTFELSVFMHFTNIYVTIADRKLT